MKIYLAGPLFTAAEYRWNEDLAMKLEEIFNHEVFLPQKMVPDALKDPSLSHLDMGEIIYLECIGGIGCCDVVVANMDGADPDSGTCFECGYAVMAGKPVFLYRTDFRAVSDAGDNPVNSMLSQCGTWIELKYDDLVSTNTLTPMEVAEAIHYSITDGRVITMEVKP